MKLKKIFFVGIKGVGMAALAILAKQALYQDGTGRAGLVVAGSDVEEEFITDKILRNEGIKVYSGFREQDLVEFLGDKKDETLVIATAAHGGFDNRQVQFANREGFKVITYGEAVGRFMSGEFLERNDLEGISVAASHGKTTISAMLACFLTKLDLEPSYVVGTSEIFPVGAAGHYGHGRFFVAEADEYAADPQHNLTPKFLYQKPNAAIFNNIDFDHPDFFENIEAVEEAFYSFAKKIQPGGVLVMNGDDARLEQLHAKLDSGLKILTYGTSSKNDFFLTNYKQSGMSGTFWVETDRLSLGEFSLSVTGIHNAKNSLSTIALLSEFGISIDKIKKVFPIFLGTKRRLEVVGKTESGNILIDDYAHHPLEIKNSLAAIRNAYPEKKIICIFQSHTYSRTQAFLLDFVAAFENCDALILLPVFASMRESNQEGVLEEEMMREFKKINKNAVFLSNMDDVIEYVTKNFRQDNSFVFVTMGAGDVYKIGSKLKAQS